MAFDYTIIKNHKENQLNSNLGIVESSLRDRIKLYKKRAHEIEQYLAKNSGDWGKFQSEFNGEINNVFREIMVFEKLNFIKGSLSRVNKLKKLFINRIRNLFMRGVYIKWSFDKPLGYAGDFKIIDDIYRNDPITTGFDRLFDNYYQMSSICMAVRNRKDDFKKIVISFANEHKGRQLKIMNLASGPCREIKEILSSNALMNQNIFFDCYDVEEKAMEYAKTLLGSAPNVVFYKQNVLRMVADKDISSTIGKKYDLIYSTGLFDYFNHKISVKLVSNLKKILNPGGIIAIASVRDKFSNPSVHFMEWVGDWNLVYRTDEDFRKIFIESGFREEDLKTQYEQQGVIQYIIAGNGIGSISL